MIDLARQMDAIKPSLASNPANAYAWSQLMDEYRGISQAMGGDDPARALASGFPAPSTPSGGGPTAPEGCFELPASFSQTTPTAIPTGPAVVTSTLVVSDAGASIWDLDLEIFLTHTFAADLDITLTSPAGTVVTLTTDNGAGNDNVFNGTVWDDQANPAGQVPYVTNNGLATDHAYVNLTLASPLVPEESLAAFRGENPNGTWTITISDDLAGDGGSLDSWTLDFLVIARGPLGNAQGNITQNTPLVIPTGPAVVSSTVSSTAPYRACGLRVLTNLEHTFAADLDITLESPSGTIATLTTDNGAGNDNVFAGTLWHDDADPDGQVPYVTNDGLATDHPYVNATLATALVPEEGTGAFQGEPLAGTWTITISDDLAGDGGTLQNWQIQYFPCACVRGSGPRVADSRASSGVSNTNRVFEPGETVNFDPRVLGAGSNFWENFDRFYPPSIPVDWAATLQAGQPSDLPWRTDSAASMSPPLSAFAGEPAHVTDNYFDTPPWLLSWANRVLDFHHSFNMEDTFDGGVLEISLNGGPFADILAAGAGFLIGGYTDTISVNFSSPIGGRQAWSGNSGGFVRTVVVLPDAMIGQTAVFRFRAASDSSVAGQGWRIDNVALPGIASADVTGVASFSGPAGPVYAIPDNAADYGTILPGAANPCFETTGDCYELSVDNAARPATHWDGTLQELLNDVATFVFTPVHIGASFGDVSTASGFYRFIETLLHHGITGGCGGGNYCPAQDIPREQMAVFLLVSKFGTGYAPPPCGAQMFNDVPCSHPFAPWINELLAQGITGGCGGGNFCPSAPVIREHMAVFLLVTLEGTGYVPPPCTTPMFGDVPCSNPFSPWVNELARRQITGGCGGGNFCPAGNVSREQMAVFLSVTFSLHLY